MEVIERPGETVRSGSAEASSVRETPEQTLEGFRYEYTEVNQNIRHYSNLRFAVLTVYFAITAGLVSVAFGATSTSPTMIRWWAKLGGLVVSIVFFALEIRVGQLLSYFFGVAGQLEKQLGYRQWDKRPRAGILEAPNIIGTLFVFIIAFWIYALSWMTG